MTNVEIGFVTVVEIPAPQSEIHGFIKNVDIVLGMLTVKFGFVILVEIAPPKFTIISEIDTNVEIALGTMTFTVNVLIFNVLKLKKGFVI